jgi:DNA repair protein RecN (Recombination protein N)
LVQLHGQSEQIMLRDIRTHIQMLDSFGNLGDARQSYHAAWLEWQKCLREEAELRQKAADLAQQKEFLGFQAEELSKAHLQPGEDILLEERLAEANGAQNRRKHLDESLEILQGEHGVIGQLSQLERALANLSAQNKGLAGFASQVGEAQILFREMSREILALGKGAPMSPAEIERDNARLALLQRLQRKYRTDLNGLIELRDRRKQELSTLDNLDASLAQLEKRSKTWRVKVDELGKQLHESRVECAQCMDQEVQSQVQSLGMASARFHTLVESADPSPLGIDRVEFLMAPNSGEGEKPLRQAVSGGELSRVLLAFKSVMAARDLVPVLVFDEVDSGISGEIAHRIGACLQKLGESHQVLTITHLHQVASRAKAHLQVSKYETDGRTLTQISTLSGEDRIREIARMLGDPNSSAVIQHARQLIEDNHA